MADPDRVFHDGKRRREGGTTDGRDAEVSAVEDVAAKRRIEEGERRRAERDL